MMDTIWYGEGNSDWEHETWQTSSAYNYIMLGGSLCLKALASFSERKQFSALDALGSTPGYSDLIGLGMA
jgi:hypothetical protein